MAERPLPARRVLAPATTKKGRTGTTSVTCPGATSTFPTRTSASTTSRTGAPETPPDASSAPVPRARLGDRYPPLPVREARRADRRRHRQPHGECGAVRNRSPGSGIVPRGPATHGLQTWRACRRATCHPVMSVSKNRIVEAWNTDRCLPSTRSISRPLRSSLRRPSRMRAVGIACRNPTSRSAPPPGTDRRSRSALRYGTIAFPTSLVISTTIAARLPFPARRTMRWSYSICPTITGFLAIRIHSRGRRWRFPTRTCGERGATAEVARPSRRSAAGTTNPKRITVLIVVPAIRGSRCPGAPDDPEHRPAPAVSCLVRTIRALVPPLTGLVLGKASHGNDSIKVPSIAFVVLTGVH